MWLPRPTQVAALMPPIVVTVTAIWSTSGQTFDASAIAGFRSLPVSWSEDSGQLIRAVDRYFTPGTSINFAVGVGVIGLVLWAVLVGRGRAKRHLILGVWIGVGAVVVVAMQRLIVRPTRDGELLVGNSLPSGHTYAFFALATAVAVAVAINVRRRSTFAIFAGSIAAWALLILISTGHRPSDVVVALLMGQSATALASGQALSRLGTLSTSAWVVGSILAASFGWVTDNPTGQVGSAVLSLGVVAVAALGAANTLERAIPAFPDADSFNSRQSVRAKLARLATKSRAGVNGAQGEFASPDVVAANRYSSIPKNSL